MKASKRFILLIVLFLCAVSLHAQGGNVAKELLESALTRQAVHPGDAIALMSRQINETLYKSLSGIFKAPTFEIVPPISHLPPSDIPMTFRVQKGFASTGTASAFAIEYDGHLYGVTAGHVMENIEEAPFMTIQVSRGVIDSLPITTWRRGNPFNVDVAVFEIPQEALPYVTPLPIAEQPLQAQQAVSIAGFTHNMPLWLPQEEILFVNTQRALVRSTQDKVALGLCGSPVMFNGKVAGLYAGFTNATEDPSKWPYLLKAVSVERMPKVHQIMLIDQVVPLLQSLIDGTPQTTGNVLKVLGISVTILRAEDMLASIDLIRDGDIIQSIYAGPLADPEHLENFLDLQDGDIVSVTILRKNNQRNMFDVDVSAGTVSQLL